MFKIKVNNNFNFEIRQEKGKLSANGQEISADIVNGMDQHVHVLHNNKSYRAEVVSFNAAEKACTVKVNGNTYILDIKDQYDELLHQLGLDNLNKVKIAELKAPMPGLVLKVFVTEGDKVQKGDNMLVLEAMKMENIIKAPGDVTIKAIKIRPADTVEKNQVMFLFE
ncbi:MAG TPA: biotin/lipoyl-containing protein [Daejeonella sp.]|nr:biotin/lipoyl-containing protein [Daejeonella sp.]